jgi:hypothetical protein
MIMQDVPNQRQILWTGFFARSGRKECFMTAAEDLAIAEAPRSQEVLGVVDWLGSVELQNSCDGVTLTVGFHQHCVRRKFDGAGCEDSMIGDLASTRKVLIQQRRRHGERLAGVVKARGVGWIDRELAGDLKILTGQISDRVVVLSVAEPAG